MKMFPTALTKAILSRKETVLPSFQVDCRFMRDLLTVSFSFSILSSRRGRSRYWDGIRVVNLSRNYH
jgi:hypothetical protein